MSVIVWTVGAVFLFLQSGSATEVTKAKVTILSQREELFRPTGEAPLQQVRFIEMKKRVDLGPYPDDPSYMTDIRFAYEAQNVGQLESYSVVQYLRGCQFISRWDGAGVKKELGIQRRYFGAIRPFQHTSWNVDAEDSADPLYSSFVKGGRFDLLRWNQNPWALDPDSAFFYGSKRPSHGVVFVEALLGNAFVSIEPTETIANNTSLEFRTCLFRSQDVPLTTDPEGRNFSLEKAVICYRWDHKYVYNFRASQFESVGPIDPVCQVDSSSEL